MARPASEARQQRLQRADQAIDGGEVGLLDLGELARVGVRHRRQARRPHGRGGMDPDVQLPEPFENRAAQPVDGAPVHQIERDQGRVAARGGEDGVVQFLQPALCAGGGDDMRPSLGQRQRALIADAARCADDEGDTVVQEQGVGHARVVGVAGRRVNVLSCARQCAQRAWSMAASRRPLTPPYEWSQELKEQARPAMPSRLNVRQSFRSPNAGMEAFLDREIEMHDRHRCSVSTIFATWSMSCRTTRPCVRFSQTIDKHTEDA